MQKVKWINGTSRDGATSRVLSYGTTTKTSVARYMTDDVNQAIADFLHDDCGVDAVYEARGESTDSFLWIWNVPILYSINASDSVPTLWGPFNSTNAIGSVTGAQVPMGTYPSYDFSVIFVGNPKTAFSIRIRKEQTGTIPGQLAISFMKARDIITGKESVLFITSSSATISSTSSSTFSNVALAFAGASTSTSTVASMCCRSAIFAVEFDDQNLPVKETSNVMGDTYAAQINIPITDQDILRNDGKFPLIKFQVGTREVDGVYFVPYKLIAVDSLGANNSEAQTEIEIDGRRFIHTSLNSLGSTTSSSKLNLPLIEVTGT